MKMRVTEEGFLIPKQLLREFDEVEVRREEDVILITPTAAEDPILEFGAHPVLCDVDDASENHDRYLYGASW